MNRHTHVHTCPTTCCKHACRQERWPQIHTRKHVHTQNVPANTGWLAWETDHTGTQTVSLTGTIILLLWAQITHTQTHTVKTLDLCPYGNTLPCLLRWSDIMFSFPDVILHKMCTKKCITKQDLSLVSHILYWVNNYCSTKTGQDHWCLIFLPWFILSVSNINFILLIRSTLRKWAKACNL